ncbi:MAB_1171c family putative transporter [Nocardia goodfellowii]|uniref:DUF6545 domain-containing protein n=1 Tax=Nocardia goodfellowii TaxID=882446 RepID=A0ABS4QNB0_9NOCA|nr:MAB_1171c family putative transporter [Nocardia goodfellowii]MBP2193033.1 hypothetical protein [Nocardia goodfellowii]
MSSLIPGYLGWPLTVWTMLSVLGRFWLFRDTAIDQMLNQLFAWCAAALLLYRLAAASDFSAPLYELAAGGAVMSTSCLYAIGCLRRGDIDSATLRRRQRRSVCIGLLSTAAIVIAGTAARSAGRPVDLGRTWDGLVITAAIGVPITVNTVVFARMVLRESSLGDLTAGERVIGSSMVASMAFVWVTQLLSILQLLTGRPQLGPHLPRAELAFTVAVVVNSIAPTLPLAMAVLRAARLDREGRACRRLEPLWRDLTAAVPEIVKPAGRPTRPPDPVIRLLRMTVEIRDALIHLAPYLPAGPAPLTERSEEFARRVAAAAATRRAGAAPIYAFSAAQLPRGAGDFESDLSRLLDLARVWPAGATVRGHRSGRRRSRARTG